MPTATELDDCVFAPALRPIATEFMPCALAAALAPTATVFADNVNAALPPTAIVMLPLLAAILTFDVPLEMIEPVPIGPYVTSFVVVL